MVKINENVNVPLSDLYTKIMGLQREDYASPSIQARVLPYEGETGERYAVRLGNESPLVFPMTDYANEQFNNRYAGLNTFAGTLHKMNLDGEYVQTVNELLRADDRQMVVRTIQPNGHRVARAFVSDMYKPIDDSLLVPSMLEIMGDNTDTWKSIGGQVTDTNSYFNFVTRSPITELNVNNKVRPVHIGVRYSNSEVGRGYAQFCCGFFDSYCQNGCWFGQTIVADVKYMHKGTKITTHFGQIFEERIQQIEQAQIKGLIVDATRLVCQGTFIPKIKTLIESSLERKITVANKAEFIKQAAKSVGLTGSQQESVLMHYEGGDNAYAVQAAITRLAHDASTYDERVNLEEAGGKIISMNDRQWKSIEALAS